MGQYALTFWLPTLVRNSGVSEPLHIGLLTSLPYLCAIIFMLLAGRSGDRHRERRWHLIVPMLIGLSGLTLTTLLSHNVSLSLFSLCIATAGILSASSLFWMLPTNLLGGVSAAAGIAAVNCIANLAGIFSPWLIGSITTATGSPHWECILSLPFCWVVRYAYCAFGLRMLIVNQEVISLTLVTIHIRFHCRSVPVIFAVMPY